MNATTYFEAYCNCLRDMRNIRYLRHKKGGIMIETDALAVKYQRLDRLATKLEERVFAILAEVDEETRLGRE